MPTYTRHEVLLQTCCDLMPPEEAARIGDLDPTDYVTFCEAYVVIRKLPTLTSALRQVLLDTIFDLMDDETATILDGRARDPGMKKYR